MHAATASSYALSPAARSAAAHNALLHPYLAPSALGALHMGLCHPLPMRILWLCIRRGLLQLTTTTTTSRMMLRHKRNLYRQDIRCIIMRQEEQTNQEDMGCMIHLH